MSLIYLVCLSAALFLVRKDAIRKAAIFNFVPSVLVIAYWFPTGRWSSFESGLFRASVPPAISSALFAAGIHLPKALFWAGWLLNFAVGGVFLYWELTFLLRGFGG